MKRFRELVERHAEQGLFISEVCAAVGVPYRTLNLYCREEFGVSPKQYLLLRQPGAGRQTVTEAAMRFGFWELGRFAAFYQAVFSERPSATLRASLVR
jgi:AraC-like DNA-binding protein